MDELSGASPGISLRPKLGQTNVTKRTTEARAEKGRLRLTGSISHPKGNPLVRGHQEIGLLNEGQGGGPCLGKKHLKATAYL